MNIILFGTPAFTLPIAEALSEIGELLAVVTQPDRPKGRKQKRTPPALKVWAQEHSIPAFQPERPNNDFAEKLKDMEPDVGIIASYGNIIPKSILDVFPKGVVNVHASLLPRHRGASPIQETILSGDTVAGVTLMLTDEEMDHGPVIAQEHLPIWPHESTHELEERLSHHAATMLQNTLPKWVAGDITPKPQQHEDATYTSLFTREDGRIRWDTPAATIERKVRAFDPWPGTYTMLLDNTRLKVLYIAVVPGEEATPGTVRKGDGDEMEIRAQDAWIRLLKVQPAGKKEMTGSAFLRGHQDLIGSVLP